MKFWKLAHSVFNDTTTVKMDATKVHGGCCGSHAKSAETSHDHGHSQGHEHAHDHHVASHDQGHNHGGSAEEEKKPRVKIVREVPPPDEDACCSAPGSNCCSK